MYYEPLFFCWSFDFVIETNRDYVNTFAMVEVMPAKQCHNRPFIHDDHVPAGGKLDETFRGL